MAGHDGGDTCLRTNEVERVPFGFFRRYFFFKVLVSPEANLQKAFGVQLATVFLLVLKPGGYPGQSMGDVNGDGKFDHIEKLLPRGHHDPYRKHWKKNTGQAKIRVTEHGGKAILWEYTLGKGIENGVHYSPVISYDADRDGKWEVYAKDADDVANEWPERITKSKERLIKLSSKGKVIAQAAWPPRHGDYNNDSRNYLAIAYLDGKKPYVIASRGTYGVVEVWAYDSDLNIIWKTKAKSSYCGRHSLICADVNGDGSDEVIPGMCVIDGTGKELWSWRGHADALFVGDFDLERPGVEMFAGLGEKSSGVGIIDAATGEVD